MSSLEVNKKKYSIEVPKTTIKISSNERVFIAGKTQSGKTTLCKFLLHTAKRLICIDGKDGMDTDWNLTDYEEGLDDRRIKNLDDYRIRLVNDKEQIIRVLNMAYMYGNTIIYIDEVTATIEPMTKAPQVIVDIWTRGAGRNIGGWANTQRPTSIPLIFLSEAENDFIFNLGLDKDRKKIADNIGSKAELKTKDKYGFYYYDMKSGKLNYYSGINL